VRKESTRGSHHRFDRIIRLSPRDGVTVSFVLFPVIGLVVTVIGGLVRRFNASVEASEPHDFAVRIGTLRPAHFRVHRSPRPTFVTIAKRPSLWGAGRGELVAVICPSAQGKWLRRIGTTGKSRRVCRVMSSPPFRVPDAAQRNVASQNRDPPKMDPGSAAHHAAFAAHCAASGERDLDPSK
jgi:hypothetical protein